MNSKSIASLLIIFYNQYVAKLNLLLLINTRCARARGVITVLGLFVCYQFPGFFSRLYDELDIATCLFFATFSRFPTNRFLFRSVLLALFMIVVSSPYERFRILTCGYNCHVE